MPTLRISYTDTTSSSRTNTITVTLSNIQGKPDPNNSSNPLKLTSGDMGYWGYSGAGSGFTFTVTDLHGDPIPEITNRDGAKALPLEKANERGYTIYINDPQNPPRVGDTTYQGNPPENGVKVERP